MASCGLDLTQRKRRHHAKGAFVFRKNIFPQSLDMPKHVTLEGRASARPV